MGSNGIINANGDDVMKLNLQSQRVKEIQAQIDWYKQFGTIRDHKSLHEAQQAYNTWRGQPQALFEILQDPWKGEFIEANTQPSTGLAEYLNYLGRRIRTRT